MMASRRAVPAAKYNEWSSPTSAPRAACIGPVSGQLTAVAADEDPLTGVCLRIYHIRRPTELAALAGLKRACVAVCFNPSEFSAFAATITGVAALFDLAKAKLVRSWSAHKARVTACTWHPLNDALVSSAGADTSVKLWDVRSGGSFLSLKGHERPVTALRFTPDGRMLTSGCEGGRIVMWDLAAGKKLHEFDPASCHRGAVTSLDFHPEEFILASTGADHTVRFWRVDVEAHAQFGLAAHSPSDTAPIRLGRFMPDGKAFVAVTADHLKVWSLPPWSGEGSVASGGVVGTGASRPKHDMHIHTLDMLEVPWGGVADVWLGSNVRARDATPSPTAAPLHLVAAAVNGASVSAWGVDMTQLAPIAPTPLHAYAMVPAPAPAPAPRVTAAANRVEHVESPVSPAKSRPAEPAIKLASDAGSESKISPDEKPKKHSHKPPRTVAVASINLDDESDDAAEGSHSAPPQAQAAAPAPANPSVAAESRDALNDTGKYSDDFEPAAPQPEASLEEPAASARRQDRPPSNVSTAEAPAASPLAAIEAAVAQAQAAAAAVRGAFPRRAEAVASGGDAAQAAVPASQVRSTAAVSPARVNVALKMEQPHTSPAAAVTAAPTALKLSPLQTPARAADAPDAFQLGRGREDPAPPARVPTRQRHDVPMPIDTSVASATTRLMRVAPELRSAAPLVPSTRTKPIGLDYASFLPSQAAVGFGMSRVAPLSASRTMRGTPSKASEVTDKIARQLMESHASTEALLRTRREAVAAAAALWTLGDVRGAVQHVLQDAVAEDRVVAEDFLRTVRVGTGAFTLESAAQTISLLARLLDTSTTERAGPILHVSQVLVSSFSPVIRATAAAVDAAPRGLEPSVEDRWARVRTCVESMRDLRDHLVRWLRDRPDAAGAAPDAAPVNVVSVLSDARALLKQLAEVETDSGAPAPPS